MDVLLSQLLTSSTGVAVKVLLENILKSSWLRNTEKARDIIEQLKSDEIQRKFIEKHVSNALRMRTLHQREHDILLDDIYYPLKLNTASHKDEVVVGDGCTLSHLRIINIVGIAGQGKSTILRKLFEEEIKKGLRIPFFIELRRVNDVGLLEYIKRTVEAIGVDINRNSNYFEQLLQSGKIVLMLDGFDEIKNQSRIEMLAAIKELNIRYNCPVIVTSRPETEICRETNVYNLMVKSLDEEAQFGILQSLSEPHEYEEIKTVILSNPDLQETLSTPILINLLYVCYPYWDELPSNIVEFYSKLFITLYLKHDRMKSWARERKSGLNTDDSLWCFSAICYFALVDEVFEFNTETLLKYARKALDAANINISECELFVDDIINITCLIQQDGLDRFVFLHKSVQEYHAANTIKNLPEDLKRDFYLLLPESLYLSGKFSNVSNFLYFIDKNAYDKYVSIECFENKGFVDLINADTAAVCNYVMDKAEHALVTFTVDDTGQLAFSSLSSLSYHLGLELLPTMAPKNIPYNEVQEVDSIVMNEVHKPLYVSDLNNYDYINDEVSDKKNLGPKYYNIHMGSFLVNNGILIKCAERLIAEVSEFYFDIYLPLKKEAEDKSKSLYKGFTIRRDMY